MQRKQSHTVHTYVHTKVFSLDFLALYHTMNFIYPPASYTKVHLQKQYFICYHYYVLLKSIKAEYRNKFVF